MSETILTANTESAEDVLTLGGEVVTTPPSDRSKLAEQGGIAQIFSGAIGVRDVIELQSVLRRASPSEMGELLSAIDPSRFGDTRDLEEINLGAEELRRDLAKIGVRKLTHVLYGALDVAAGEITSIPVSLIAPGLGVSSTAITALEVGYAVGNSVPDTYNAPRTVMDELREKYGQ